VASRHGQPIYWLHRSAVNYYYRLDSTSNSFNCSNDLVIALGFSTFYYNSFASGRFIFIFYLIVMDWKGKKIAIWRFWRRWQAVKAPLMVFGDALAVLALKIIGDRHDGADGAADI